MSTRNDWHFRLPAYEYIISLSGVQAVPRETRAYFNVLHTLLYRSIDASFVDFVIVFTFHDETKTKA